MATSIFPIQAPKAVVMIRPSHFSPNPQTAADNAFQVMDGDASAEQVAKAAYDEVTNMVAGLRAQGVTVHLFEDDTNEQPDSVFPNNWFSTHLDGRIAIYPMYSQNRRLERRSDVIDLLKAQYQVDVVVDYSSFEYRDAFLEGTGAMVLDHIEKVAYAARSRRMSDAAFVRFCADYGYEPVAFEAEDQHGQPIYHTNVMMSVATEFAVIGLSTIRDDYIRNSIVTRLEKSGREIVDLSVDQINNFAANCLELTGRSGRVLAISQRGLDALTPDQIAIIEKSAAICPFDVQTIERAGGSVRCMLAGIHLPASADCPDKDAHELGRIQASQ